MSSSNSPCAACKCLRRKCTKECVYAPYFPPEEPQKFDNVHKVFGASNVAKLLNELPTSQREDAVISLAYEAEYRIQNPVYGCVGLISILQHRLKQVQYDLFNAKKELATYIGPSAMLPIMQQGFIRQQHLNNNPSSSAVMPFHVQPMMGAQVIICDPQQQQQQQQMVEAQQMAAAREQQREELFIDYEQRQQPPQQQTEQPPPQQHQLMRFDGDFDVVGVTLAPAYNPMVATSMTHVTSTTSLGSDLM